MKIRVRTKEEMDVERVVARAKELAKRVRAQVGKDRTRKGGK
jgi:hypothetical protein